MKKNNFAQAQYDLYLNRFSFSFFELQASSFSCDQNLCFFFSLYRKKKVQLCVYAYSYKFTKERFPRPGEQAGAEVNGKMVDHVWQITKEITQIPVSSGIATLDKLL